MKPFLPPKQAFLNTIKQEFLPVFTRKLERKAVSKARGAGISALQGDSAAPLPAPGDVVQPPITNAAPSGVPQLLNTMAGYYRKGMNYLKHNFPGLYNTINPYLTSITSTIKPYMSTPYLPPKQAHFWKQASMQRTPQDPASLIKQAFIGKMLGNAATKGLSALGRAGNAASDFVGRGTAGAIRGLNRQAMRIPGMESGFLSRAMTKELRNPAAQRAAGQTVLGIGGAAAVAPALQARLDNMEDDRVYRRVQRLNERYAREGQRPPLGPTGFDPALLRTGPPSQNYGSQPQALLTSGGN